MPCAASSWTSTRAAERCVFGAVCVGFRGYLAATSISSQLLCCVEWPSGRSPTPVLGFSFAITATGTERYVFVAVCAGLSGHVAAHQHPLSNTCARLSFCS